MTTLERHDGVYVLDLGADENAIDDALLGAIEAALDDVEAAPPPRALVTTGSGRFFTTGLDVAAIARNPDRVDELVQRMHRLFARLLALPVPTVAAINGHAFAGGGLFALAHDRRVMRADRGYFCLPEVDGRIAFTPGLSDLLVSRLGATAALEAATSGRRYTAPEAERLGFVEATSPADQLLEVAVAMAASQADKDPTTLGTIKARLQRGTIASLLDSRSNAVRPAEFTTMIAALKAET